MGDPGCPRVVAKGSDGFAAKIRERVREHGVLIVEDKPLTRLLHRVCGVDDEIPAELHAAVARILAFVMSLRWPSSGARRPVPVELPELPSKAALRTRRRHGEGPLALQEHLRGLWSLSDVSQPNCA